MSALARSAAGFEAVVRVQIARTTWAGPIVKQHRSLRRDELGKMEKLGNSFIRCPTDRTALPIAAEKGSNSREVPSISREVRIGTMVTRLPIFFGGQQRRLDEPEAPPHRTLIAHLDALRQELAERSAHTDVRGRSEDPGGGNQWPMRGS